MYEGEDCIVYTDGLFIALAHDEIEEIYCMRAGLRLMDRDEVDKLFDIEEQMTYTH